VIKVVIIEDEAPARKKLKNYLAKTEDPTVVIQELESIQESLLFLNTAPEVDIIFSDIELRDGNVFEVYNQVTISCPVIFTTAYDKFWMNAFETNGIEYLLKPYSYDRFIKAWNKYTSLKKELTINKNDLIKQLDDYYLRKSRTVSSYSEYIPIKSSKGIYFLKVVDVAYIQSDYGVIFAYDNTAKKHLLSQTSLSEVIKILNPTSFFKINRSELVNRAHIEKINRYSKNRMAIYLKAQELILKTSQSNTAEFNAWLGL